MCTGFHRFSQVLKMRGICTWSHKGTLCNFIAWAFCSLSHVTTIISFLLFLRHHLNTKHQCTCTHILKNASLSCLWSTMYIFFTIYCTQQFPMDFAHKIICGGPQSLGQMESLFSLYCFVLGLHLMYQQSARTRAFINTIM